MHFSFADRSAESETVMIGLANGEGWLAMHTEWWAAAASSADGTRKE